MKTTREGQSVLDQQQNRPQPKTTKQDSMRPMRSFLGQKSVRPKRFGLRKNKVIAPLNNTLESYNNK